MIQRPGRIALLLAGLVCIFLLAPLLAVVPDLVHARALPHDAERPSVAHPLSRADRQSGLGAQHSLESAHRRRQQRDRDRACARLLARRVDDPAALRGADGRLCPLADDRAADRLGDDPLFFPDKPLRGQRRDRL